MIYENSLFCVHYGASGNMIKYQDDPTNGNKINS